MSVFSDKLVELRKTAGFRSAYAFFTGNGGKNYFKSTYASYAMTEQGAHLPTFQRLRLIISALPFRRSSKDIKDLLLTWLRESHGDGAFRDVLLPLLKIEPPKNDSPLVSTLKKLISQKTVPVSMEQLRAMLADQEHFRCALLLASDPGSWTCEEVASGTGLPIATVRRIVGEFRKTGLVNAPKPGYFYTPMAHANINLPSPKVCGKLMERFEEHVASLKAGGTEVFCRRHILRADMDALHDFHELMKMAHAALTPYTADKKTRDDSWLVLENRTFKLLDF